MKKKTPLISGQIFWSEVVHGWLIVPSWKHCLMIHHFSSFHLFVMFSNMVTNDQVIVNPPAPFRSTARKYYGFPAKDSTVDKSKTICQICSATFKYCAGFNFKHEHTLKMPTQHWSKNRSVGLKDGKNFTRYETVLVRKRTVKKFTMLWRIIIKKR